jgi:uncharacterized protein YbaP (TraB family)
MIRRAALLCLLLTGLALQRPAAAAAAVSDGPFLWEVQGPLATHYLLGSVHLLPQAAQSWPAGIADAYDAADGLIFEADIGALESPQTGLALLAAGRSAKGLRSELDAATYTRLQKQLAATGLPGQFCDGYKPWFCALTLEVAQYQKAGFKGEYGFDRQLYQAAKTDGKPVHGLETLSQHLGTFVDMGAPLSKLFLVAELADADGPGIDSPAAMYHAWQNNDVAAITALAEDMKRQSPQVYARLLADRTRAWLPRLKPWLDGDQPQLIVVGAAHLVGSEGLVEQLRARGYRVQQHVGGGDAGLLTRGPAPAALPNPVHPGATAAGMAAAGR